MKNTKRLIFLVLLMTSVTMSLFAQLSDQQVIEELKLYKTSGMTQEQVFIELSKKGVSMEQLERIKQSYISGQFKKQTKDIVVNNETSRIRTNPDTTNILAVMGDDITANTQQNSDNNIYGADIFASKNLTFRPNINMPTPENYLLGSGDEVIIDIWGTTELNVREKISPDGTILIQGIGPVQLSGLQIDKALVKLRNAFGQIYSDLLASPARAFISLSLGNIRSIQVNVLGEVNLPGTYTLSSFATVFNALYSAGGINTIGSLRDIQVSRGGKVVARTDVYEYLIKGTSSGDVMLRDGDIVRVMPYKKRVQILGEVKRPMWYDLKDKETLNTLIEYAGGFLGEAYKKSIALTRKGDNELKVYTVKAFQYDSFSLSNADVITVGKILDLYENRVTVEGAIFRPGEYAIDNELKTVGQLIKMAQGTTGDAFLKRALLYREKQDLTLSVISLDLEAILSGRSKDVELRKNDKLYISSILHLDDHKYLEITGAIRSPGEYDYADNMSIEDLIIRAGGLKESASLARIDIFRRIKNPMSAESAQKTGETFSFTIEDSLSIKNTVKFALQPYDLVVVRTSPGYETQQIIQVTGEVLFEGSYAKIEKDERLSSFIKRAGGITKYAYIKGARLTRLLNKEERQMLSDAMKLAKKNVKDSISVEELKQTPSTYFVGIDLEKAIQTPGKEDDLILRDGDVISVPQYNGTVKISGAVMYPNTIAYDKRYTLRDYIRNAGGYAINAKSNKVYVIYMNGKISTGIWSKIEPGCEIIVPLKPDREPMSIQEITGITSSALSMTVLIVTLLKRL